MGIAAADTVVRVRNDLSSAELETIRAGGLLNRVRTGGDSRH